MIGARLLIFARAPIAGATKTRLIPALGAVGAARLHTALVRHALSAAAAAAPQELQLWVTGEDPDGLLADLARESGATLHEQPAGDLGARMGHALSKATADGMPAIILGSDCPWITASVIRESAGLLETADAVLGPADDGGYVLLGLHRVAAPLFEGIEWGHGDVLEATRERLRALAWHWRELPARPDLDRPADLEVLAELGEPWARLARPEPP